jgi:phosphatidylglycerophosphatase A
MKIHKYIATSLGMGHLPIAPGTVGAIFGILVQFIINSFLGSKGFNQTEILFLNVVAIIFVTFLGLAAIKKVHTIWEHDASKIVIDEVVGVWITALFLPLNWKYYLYALIIFRFFDIAKPLFIKKFDQMHNDWSVMLDDVLAGIYGLITMQLLIHFNII